MIRIGRGRGRGRGRGIGDKSGAVERLCQVDASIQGGDTWPVAGCGPHVECRPVNACHTLRRRAVKCLHATNPVFRPSCFPHLSKRMR